MTRPDSVITSPMNGAPDSPRLKRGPAVVGWRHRITPPNPIKRKQRRAAATMVKKGERS